MHFTKKQKGTVSVFLTLVLLPTIICACLTTDAAKIYTSKVVVSDSGELAMNAALAQYEDALFDQYGLLAMSKKPEAMQSELEQYFINSLNSGGIPGAANYAEMLTLLEQSFEAISVSNTEVYRTEVEKQQILEYMKYRAPVCLAELVLEKIGFIRDSRKLLNAMNKEMDFAETMEECQDAFEDALKALDALDNTIESLPTDDEIYKELGATQDDFTKIVGRCLLMEAAIQRYDERPSGESLEQMINKYIDYANKVDMRDPYSEDSYSNYLEALKYYNGISAAGGVSGLGGDTAAPDPEEDPDGYADWAEQNQNNSNLINDYNEAKEHIANYVTTLHGLANSCVATHHDKLYGYYTMFSNGATQAESAYKKLDYVHEKLLQAMNAYNAWDQATDQLSKEQAGNMKDRVDEYRDFFGDDLYELELLQKNVDLDKEYFTAFKEILTEETLFTIRIVTTDTATQVNQYSSKAATAVSGNALDYYEYNEIETMREESFVAHYNHTASTPEHPYYRIHDDPFYTRLQNYCEKHEDEEADKNAKEANGKLDEGTEGAEDAKDATGFPSFDWSSASQDLPSVVLGLSSYTQASETYTDLETDINIKKKSSRRNIVKKMKDSINEAQNFLDGVDSILERNVENLYIAEYAMQMFSYYTCDKKMKTDKSLETIKEKDNISISGFMLSANKAYKAEIEYILWGDKSSAKNVLSTMALLFGIRLLFNSFFVFTDAFINGTAAGVAAAIAGPAPYLIPIIKIVYKFGLASVETTIDLTRLKEGYGVAILKTDSDNSFETLNRMGIGDVRNGVTFDYGEYLRVFLNIQMIAGKEDKVLARIGDCVQVNTNTDITKDYTMIELQANIGVKTAFLRKIAQWSSYDWEYDDVYTVNYKSVLGY